MAPGVTVLLHVILCFSGRGWSDYGSWSERFVACYFMF